MVAGLPHLLSPHNITSTVCCVYWDFRVYPDLEQLLAL
jgi:hypothetical protein